MKIGDFDINESDDARLFIFSTLYKILKETFYDILFCLDQKGIYLCFEIT